MRGRMCGAVFCRGADKRLNKGTRAVSDARIKELTRAANRT